MNIRQLEAFYWIVRLGSFGAAAEKLGASQPAISARIKELEQSLGTLLFVRGSKALVMSPPARALYPLAEEALGIMARIRNDVGTNEGIGGIVRIGMGEIVALSWFPDFLARLNALYPTVQLQIFMDITTNLHRMMEEGQLDLALAVTPGGPNFSAQSVGSTPLRWMASPSLVRPAGNLSPEELGRLPIYTLSRKSHLHARAIKWFHDRGARPVVVHNCNNLSVIIKLVKIGCGIALIPPILVEQELQSGTLQIIAGHSDDERTEFFLIRHEDMVDRTILKIAEMAVQTTIFDLPVAPPSPTDNKRMAGKF
jgi:DNA-binding transcriptional LysR family regulator